jgi:tRNA dimethylallyltransferase
MPAPPLILIHGPTASGKSALAMALARSLGAAVVNADSMQVYADLRVLTARPTHEDEAEVPHWLFGQVDASVRHSVGDWVRAARAVIDDVRGSGRAVIVVGGTGLYLRALTQGLVDVPAVPPEIDRALRASVDADVTGQHARLAAVDPAAAARIGQRDHVRIVRALGVHAATGRTLSAWQAEATGQALQASLRLTVWPDRAALACAIADRFTAMIEGGAIEEARALWQRRLDPTLPCMKAHGMPWLIAHFEDRMTLEEAKARSVIDTRQYAKRQFTWMRNQLTDWHPLCGDDTAARARHVLSLLAAQAQ